MLFFRGLLVWLIIIIVESVHGILRTLLLTPLVGDFHARQIAVFTGMFLIFLISILFIRWIDTKNKSTLLFIGLMWVVLTIAFEIGAGRIAGFSWSRILSDYNLMKGGLMPLGIIFLFFAPLLAAKATGYLKK